MLTCELITNVNLYFLGSSVQFVTDKENDYSNSLLRLHTAGVNYAEQP